jgi:hypothetical protein
LDFFEGLKEFLDFFEVFLIFAGSEGNIALIGVDLDNVTVDLAVLLTTNIELFVGLYVVDFFVSLLLDDQDQVGKDEQYDVELFLLIDELDGELVEVLDGLFGVFGGLGLVVIVLFYYVKDWLFLGGKLELQLVQLIPPDDAIYGIVDFS